MGGILMNNDAMNQVMDILSPDDFYREAHMSLFEGMAELYNLGEPIDMITLSQFLSKKNLFYEILRREAQNMQLVNIRRDCLTR